MCPILDFLVHSSDVSPIMPSVNVTHSKREVVTHSANQPVPADCGNNTPPVYSVRDLMLQGELTFLDHLTVCQKLFSLFSPYNCE